MQEQITASNHLCLRYYTTGDEHLLFAYTNDAESSKFLARKRHENLAQTKNMLLALATPTSLDTKDIGIWIIADVTDQKAMGYLTLVKAGDAIEIHFGLLAEHRGKGFAQEAIKLAAEYLLGTLGFAEVVSFTDTENFAAKAALVRAGFSVVGVKKEFYSAPLLPGKKRDVYWLRYMA